MERPYSLAMAVIRSQDISKTPVYVPFTTERVAVYAQPSERGVLSALTLRLPLESYQMSPPIDSPKHQENGWYAVYPLGEHVMLKAFREVALSSKGAKKRLASLIELAQIIDVRLEEGWAISLVDNIDEDEGCAKHFPSVLFAPPGRRASHEVDVTLWAPAIRPSRRIRNLTEALTSVEAVQAVVRTDPLLGQATTVNHKLVRNGQLTEKIIEEHRQEQEQELLSVAIAKHPDMEVGRLLALVEAARAFVSRGPPRALAEGKKQLSTLDAG